MTRFESHNTSRYVVGDFFGDVGIYAIGGPKDSGSGDVATSVFCEYMSFLQRHHILYNLNHASTQYL